MAEHFWTGIQMQEMIDPHNHGQIIHAIILLPPIANAAASAMHMRIKATTSMLRTNMEINIGPINSANMRITNMPTTNNATDI